MKKIFLLITIALLSTNSFAQQNISNDKQFAKYLEEYGKEAAPYLLCGDEDSIELSNIGTYFDEILTLKYLKVQIKRYGSQEKAAWAAIHKADIAVKKEQHRLVDKGFSSNNCNRLTNQ